MKKRDRDTLSASLALARGGEHHRSGSSASAGSPFSLSRFLPSRSRRRNRSKSGMSLDSDSARSESSLASHAITSASLPAVHASLTPAPLPRTSNNCNLNSASGAALASGGAAMSSGDVGLSACSFPATSLSSMSSSRRAGGPWEGPSRECPVCLTEQSVELFPPIQTCHHRSCLQCLRQYLAIEISESRVNIACPECNERFHPNDMRLILDDELLMNKYEDFMLRRVLAMDPDTRWCPAPDCGYAVIATGCAGCPKLKCEREGCDTYFCYHCKQYWHPNQTCDAARAERSPNMRSASISYSHESNAQNEIKPCPRCGAFIVKMNDGSCNHMTCAVCAAEFCWLCMKEISDLHYLSPSGCTFWGRKPWSRKKKILWQLGTLVGAPVGITLVAGIAVPAMIIGIPVWVGRKIHTRYRMASRHRRNLAVTGGVAASILASPIIAGLAVGIGVPFLLAYVYGVVPISLCRSGGCGVTTTSTGGVRFEFDEENEGNPQGNFPGDNHSEITPAVANPSIAPSIGDASLGMTNSLSASGSHMDRVGVLRDADSDRDSASNRAIAGASLNGSLCGSTYTNKLEVQADMAPGGTSHKRASFSSESANISLSEKSATVSFDEAGLRVYYSDTTETVEPNGASSQSHHPNGSSFRKRPPPPHPRTPSPEPLSGPALSPQCHKERVEADISVDALHHHHHHHHHCQQQQQHSESRATELHSGPSGSACRQGIGSELSAEQTARSSHPVCKGAAVSLPGDEARQGAKCKKLTRFLDDMPSARHENEARKRQPGATATTVFPGSCRASGSTGRGFGGRVRKLSLEGRHSEKRNARHGDAASVRSLPLPLPADCECDSPAGRRGHPSTCERDGLCPSPSEDSSAGPARDYSQMAISPVDQDAQYSPSQYDSCTWRINIATELGPVSITEVDTDRPVSRHQSSVSTHSPPVHHARSLSFTLSCSSLHKTDLDAGPGEAVCNSMGEGRAEAGTGGLRRHSYELAYRHGRISPSLWDHSH